MGKVKLLVVFNSYTLEFIQSEGKYDGNTA